VFVLPFYLMASILIVYVAIMRALFAPIASACEPYEWLDRFDERFYKILKGHLP
jgi:hypothetical protein